MEKAAAANESDYPQALEANLKAYSLPLIQTKKRWKKFSTNNSTLEYRK